VASVGAYGLPADLAHGILADESADVIDAGGVGGTRPGTRCPWRPHG